MYGLSGKIKIKTESKRVVSHGLTTSKSRHNSYWTSVGLKQFKSYQGINLHPNKHNDNKSKFSGICIEKQILFTYVEIMPQRLGKINGNR